MARLQILELPEGGSDERPPFILVIDQVDDDLAQDIASWPEDIAKRTGARQVLCFPCTIDIPAIDIPANDTTAYTAAGGPDAHLTLGGQDLRGLIAGDTGESTKQTEAAPIKSRENWCCSLAFQTLGRQHSDDCRNA